ncbi:flagellar hook-basal body complex protein FliE [Cedecea colo]|uniref:Flagellar hook-basal body complex protein FliE n=1 Tax=Cedecea colo TaxID=2552946 RepID=A0ABX0VQT8_9ENTR|nr:flagellar hook-basal body complex protein FliE [Cedecea colo]NIY48667.1 flagellar hook-basal body complex protein FliE [Cedecea colo]
MATPAMNSVLEQIQFQSRQITGLSNGNVLSDKQNAANSVSFSSLLFNSINGISQMQTAAKTQAQNYITGASDIGLSDVMVSLQKASVALNMGIQVRNKMVSAYQEIMNMAV